MNEKSVVEMINEAPNNIKIGKGKIDIIDIIKFNDTKESGKNANNQYSR